MDTPHIRWIPVCVVILLLVFTRPVDATEAPNVENRLELTFGQKQEKFLWTTATGVGVITAWGIAKWDYFTVAPHAQSEGWFGNDTSNGGADKLGHMYSSYVATHALSALYEYWQFRREDAALYGALSSFVIMGYMEFGDAFSDYGFSNEDLLANTAGILWGYLTYRDPVLASRLDFRWEYGIHPSQADLVTDYENSKFLVALKLNGFEACRKSWLRHLEFHAGYYTRGFEDDEPDRERNMYAGVAINLTDMFARYGHRKTATVLRYLQVPGTYLQLADDVN
ncbi:hypothetical protein BVY04_01195 [bacterium M21]|nr:hypothetical protein BVY04_01195 [bacterium M21]